MTEKRYGNYSLRELAIPFWKGDAVYGESILPLRTVEGATAEGRLLYPPDEIAEVRHARLDVVYEEGKDWVWDKSHGRLRFPAGSRVPVTSLEELFPHKDREGWVQLRRSGGYSLFSEGHFFHDKMISVSYTCRKDGASGPNVSVAPACPKRTAAILGAGRPLRLLVFGDSIAEGANASGKTGVPPFLPTWGEIVAGILEAEYGSTVEYRNGSVGGITSERGLQLVGRVLEDTTPDLAILAFGMNDGTGKMPKEQYAANLSAIVDRVLAANDAAEFILVAPMLANPETHFAGNQADYAEELFAMARAAEGRIAVADMTAVHRELLRHKNYADLTGNHVNHPNDFLIRCYAQVILTLLATEGKAV
ncbi:SGNH/GDSL hydrolase family protein [Cohnella fermenti]|uniref:SGNH/GDSL hydrolase family protein n=1 Tax=Cohnella fermenti TaxID=2565925 RepID=A0A4S4C3R1_9BACL|nr:SGNH/GDSL hydrolase family protein [Cohnella fermenti]THF80289.1 SGNH/GDSL hydrolase family protein [Cohnella fermenti]